MDPPAEAYEEKFTSDIIRGNDVFFDVAGFTLWAQRDEFSNAIQGDIVLLTVGYFIIIGYMSFVLGNKCDRVHSRVALALCAVLR